MRDATDLTTLRRAYQAACEIYRLRVEPRGLGECADRLAELAATAPVDAELALTAGWLQLAAAQDRGDYLRAARLAETLIRDSEAVDSPRVQGFILLAASSLAGRQGDLERLRELLERLRSLLDAHPDSELAVRHQINLALLANLQKQPAASDAALRRAREWQQGDPRLAHMEALLLLTEAARVNAAGDLAASLSLLNEAHEVATRLQQRRLLNFIELQRAERLLSRSEFAAALEAAEQAVEGFRNEGARGDEVQAMVRLAGVQAAMGRHADAYATLLSKAKLDAELLSEQHRLALAEMNTRLDLGREIEARRDAEMASRDARRELETTRWQLTSALLLSIATALALALSYLHRQRLRRSRAVLKRAEEMRAQWLIRIAHDLRQPTQAILSGAELARAGKLTHGRQQETLAQAAQYLGRLVADLYDLARSELKQLRLIPEMVDLPQLLEDCIRLHEAAALAKGLHLGWQREAGVPPRIQVDPVRLKQVLGNLIANAIKYSLQGSIRLHCMRVGGDLCFDLSDQGPGFKPDERERIFEPFYSGRLGEDDAQGSGLGLSIARQLAHTMGGRLELLPAQGVGATFRLSLPLVLASSISKPEVESPDPALRVLVVDDDDLLANLVCAQLQMLGVSARASTAIDALAAELQRQPVDLLVLDHDLGTTTGPTLLARLPAQGFRHAIMLSGNEAPSALPSGLAQWLVKPVGMAQWRQVLASLFGSEYSARKVELEPL